MLTKMVTTNRTKTFEKVGDGDVNTEITERRPFPTCMADNCDKDVDNDVEDDEDNDLHCPLYAPPRPPEAKDWRT
jgi:hypothetical protein